MHTKANKNAECARLMGWNPPGGTHASWWRVPEDATYAEYYADFPCEDPPPYLTDSSLTNEVLDDILVKGFHVSLDAQREAARIEVHLAMEPCTFITSSQAPTWQEAVVDARIALGAIE